MRAVLLLLSLIVTACAAPQPSLAVYSGPAKALSEVASIRGSNLCAPNGSVIGETRIVEINGVEAQSFSKGYQRDLLVQPGQIALKVVWFYANLSSKEPATIQVNASAGHRYVVRARTDYKETVTFNTEDKGPKSGEVDFTLPVGADGKPSNCY